MSWLTEQLTLLCDLTNISILASTNCATHSVRWSPCWSIADEIIQQEEDTISADLHTLLGKDSINILWRFHL